MPICVPIDLPAAKTLAAENIFVMDHARATTQDIRPLRILILNLMPTKIVTETQLARLLGNSPLQVEHLAFEDVDYWDELCAIMEWTKSHVYSTFHICWGAQAALYYHYGVPKVPLAEKLFGVFPHTVTHKNAILFRGFDDVFYAPHSRHTTLLREDLEKVPALKILAESEEAGVYAVSTDGGRQIFITGHSEYDTDTLDREYRRDKEAGLPIRVPAHYYPGDDETKAPRCDWRSGANLLYANWLNYFVYQATPYDVTSITSF